MITAGTSLISSLGIESRGKNGYSLLLEILKAVSVFPYENISKILRLSHKGACGPEALRRYPETILKDHRDLGLGGTCFSLTWFLKEILEHFSMDYYLITADMSTGKNVHCAAVAFVQGKKYLLDPGYLYSKPLIMDADRTAVMGFTNAAVIKRDGRYRLCTYTEYSGIKERYVFDDAPVDEALFLRRWDESFNGRGMNNICVSRVAGDKQIFFLRDFMRVSSIKDKRNIKVRGCEGEKISEYFGIDDRIYKKAVQALDGLRTGHGKTAV